LRRAGRVPVYLHDPSVHGWKDHRQTRREIIVIGGPMRHDTLSKTECDQTDAWAEKPPHNHERQDAVVVPEKLGRPGPAQV
jgi:hypothetical protein